MADAEVTRKENMIVLGDDQIRIEAGPVRKTAVATEELLHDDQTAPHYYAGTRPRTFNTPKGPITIDAPGIDSLGKEIKIGEPMTYLDHGGRENPGERCFYISGKKPIDPAKETFDDGTRNPHYVPPHVRAGAALANDGTPPNRTHYEYIFETLDTVPIGDDLEAAEQAAIARGQQLLAQAGE
jgi:hypothetical protein